MLTLYSTTGIGVWLEMIARTLLKRLVLLCLLVGVVPLSVQASIPKAAGGGGTSQFDPTANKPGSFLLFNFFSSSLDPELENTRVSLTNTNPHKMVSIHIFFIDSEICAISAWSVTLTASQTVSFLTGEINPLSTGYIIAITVDEHGCPVNFNHLIGDEFVKLEGGHAANLAGLSVAALPGSQSLCDPEALTADLIFDGVRFGQLPRTVVIDNLPSIKNGNKMMVILNPLGGNLTEGAARLGNLEGLLFDDLGVSYYFEIASAGCQLRGILQNNFPRTDLPYDMVIPSRRTGWIMYYAVNDLGMHGAAINYNPDGFNQGHNLHVMSLTSSVVYTIPIYPPN